MTDLVNCGAKPTSKGPVPGGAGEVLKIQDDKTRATQPENPARAARYVGIGGTQVTRCDGGARTGRLRELNSQVGTIEGVDFARSILLGFRDTVEVPAR